MMSATLGPLRCWEVLNRVIPLAVGLVGLALTSAARSQPDPTPKIHFNQAQHDFGRMKRGEQAAHAFVFENRGDATLELRDVRVDCGCTTAENWDRQIPPGKTGRIPVRFDSTSFQGSVTKTITVVSNDPRHAIVELRLSAFVWLPVEVTPSTVFFHHTGDPTSTDSRTVRIINRLPQPLHLEAAGSTHRAFAAEWRPIKSGQEFELTIRTVPPLDADNISGEVTVPTSAAEMPFIRVQATAVKRPAVALSPPRITLPATLPAAGTEAIVSIMSMSSHTLALSDARSSLPGVAVSLQELQPGLYFTVKVAFPAGFALHQDDAAEVTVKTNHPSYPVLRIPIVRHRRP